MNYKKFLKISIFVSLLGIVLGYILLYPETFGICSSENRDCIYPLAFNFGEPLMFGLIPVTIAPIAMLFSSESVFKLWKKFALVYVPLSVLWIIFSPVSCNAPANMCFDKEMISWITSVGFLVITLGIIIYKKFRL